MISFQRHYNYDNYNCLVFFIVLFIRCGKTCCNYSVSYNNINNDVFVIANEKHIIISNEHHKQYQQKQLCSDNNTNNSQTPTHVLDILSSSSIDRTVTTTHNHDCNNQTLGIHTMNDSEGNYHLRQNSSLSSLSLYHNISRTRKEESSNRKLVRRNHCPPDGFNALSIFNLTAYISARWYPIRQKPVIYSGEETFCSYAQYSLNTNPSRCFIPFLCHNDRIRINVINRGLRGSVNGSEDLVHLSAVIPNPLQNPAKIQVSFPSIFGRTNYWVVAAGTYQDIINGTYEIQPTVTPSIYEWAIISGGAPNVRTSNGKCVAGTLGRFDTRGLWMFSRQPQPPSGVIDSITNFTNQRLGLDTTTWRNVTHVGCTNY